MTNEEDYKKLLEKVEKATQGKKLDINMEEDLVVGIMNLIGIEEHLFFTAEKTGKDSYLELLNEVRAMRVELLRKIIKDYEGEVWCASKHLLSASMRMMEVGTKHLKSGDKREAKEYFDRAYNLYNLFWALNMKIIDTKTLKSKGIVTQDQIMNAEKQDSKAPTSVSDRNFFSKIGDLVKKAIDCCKE